MRRVSPGRRARVSRARKSIELCVFSSRVYTLTYTTWRARFFARSRGLRVGSSPRLRTSSRARSRRRRGASCV
eukprot:13194031-Alexandrium_andersonii.AAC.1